MPSDQLTRGASDDDIRRELYLDSGPLRLEMERGLTPTLPEREERLRGALRTARREQHASLWWDLAVMMWVAKREDEAIGAARECLKLRVLPELDRKHESARARLRKSARKADAASRRKGSAKVK
jgi:hypothetical protein